MLNDDKIKLMTGIAMFEKKEGSLMFKTNRYFKSDYISSHMIRSFFSFTFCTILILIIWALYHSEMLFNSVTADDIQNLSKCFGLYYIAGLVIFEMITISVYAKRYNYAIRSLKVYVAKLRHLNKRYDFQTKSRELAKEGRHYDGSTRI